MVMYLHAMAVRGSFDIKKAWTPALMCLLWTDTSKYRESETFNRTLALTLELLELGTAISGDLGKMVAALKAQVNESTFTQSSFMLSLQNKFYRMVLQQMGFKDVQMEKHIRNGMLQCDLYIGDLDMLIDIHGPCHYLNRTRVPIDSTLYLEKIYRRYHKHFIAISYEHL